MGATAAPNVRLKLELSEFVQGHTSTTIEGQGELSGAGPTTPVTVRGERVGPNVSLTIVPEGYMAISLTARLLKAGTRLEGMMLGSGIVDLPFTLAREEAAEGQDR